MDSAARFKVISLIGEGGMGKVWRVFDTQLGTTRALKISKHPRSDSELAAAVRESSIWFTFRHIGHVVEVYEILKFESGVIGILMEYVEEGSLRSAIDAGVLTRRDKLLALYDVSCGLRSCDETLPGFCHLDIKPENCLRTKYRLTKLTDFGLASSCRVDLSREALGGARSPLQSVFFRSKLGALCSGTPLYMAPEQILGLDTVGGASDIYALGVLALELFCDGHPLSASPDVESVFGAHLSGVLRQLAQARLSLEFGRRADILIDCLAVDPANRPTIAEVNSFLAEAFDGPAGYRRFDLPKLPDTVDDTIRSANSLSATGYTDEAIDLLRRSVEVDPFHAEFWLCLSTLIWTHRVQPYFSEDSANEISKALLRIALYESCWFGIRALLLDKSCVSPNTQEGILVRTIIPQTTYQLAQGGTDMKLGYRTWSDQLVSQQSGWLQEQQMHFSETEGGSSRCLCVRCGEVKMYQVMRCPRCGFLPLEVEDLYLTGVLHIARLKQLPNNQAVSYSELMRQLRTMGRDLASNIAAVKRRPEYRRCLEVYARGEGAQLYNLVHNGPTAGDVRRIKKFVAQIGRKGIMERVTGVIGRLLGE